MKTCKKCKWHGAFYCFKFKIAISSTLNAAHCSSYEITEHFLELESVKCINCESYYYGWCKRKKKSIENCDKEISCIKYHYKPAKKTKKYDS